MTTVDYRIKNLFLDREHIKRALGAANARNIGKALAFVRRSARSSLRRRNRPSAPGMPPSVHAVNDVASLKNILFGYDPKRQAGIVGPVKLNGGFMGPARIAGTVPEVQEFGGFGTVKVVKQDVKVGRGRNRRTERQWRVLVGRPKPWQQAKTVGARWPSRPFMGPALRQEAPKFPSLWLNTVRD